MLPPLTDGAPVGLYGVLLGVYWDNGKDNGNYYNGLYWGLGFRVQGLRIEVWGSGFRVWGLGELLSLGCSPP